MRAGVGPIAFGHSSSSMRCQSDVRRPAAFTVCPAPRMALLTSDSRLLLKSARPSSVGPAETIVLAIPGEELTGQVRAVTAGVQVVAPAGRIRRTRGRSTRSTRTLALNRVRSCAVSATRQVDERRRSLTHAARDHVGIGWVVFELVDVTAGPDVEVVHAAGRRAAISTRGAL